MTSRSHSTSLFDAIVIGGGMAGSTAALRAAELGCRVLLLEKGADDRYLCNARFSGGVFHIAFQDLQSSEADLLAAATAVGDGGEDPAQVTAIVKRGAQLVEWLRAQGGQFIRGMVPWQRYILAPPRRIAAGTDWMGRGPDVLLRRMADRFLAAGGQRILGAEATGLVMRDGICCGVEAIIDGKTVVFESRAVVLADGGFQADLDLLRRHITPAPEKLKQRGAATGQGSALRMAETAGAAMVRLDRFYGHLLCRDSMINDKTWPYPELDALATSGIVVDTQGRRVVDEGVGGVPLANALAKQPDPLAFTVIIDKAIWEGPGKSARIPANPTLESAGGTIHQAELIAELATRAGIAPQALEECVRLYNAAIAGEGLAGLTPPRSTRMKPHPIVTPPFRAIPLCVGITYTMGGIRVDGDARVLTPSGSAIAGLYAAGSTTGGLEGGSRSTYLGGLVKAGTQGLAAAEHIAAARKV